MLINLYIDNFRGIKNEVKINTIASNKLKRSYECYYKLNDTIKILKSICIIGANGSGKTSILDSISTLQTFISFPLRKKITESEDYNKLLSIASQDDIRRFFKSFNTLNLGEKNIYNETNITKIELEILVPKRDNNISGIYLYKLHYSEDYINNGVILEELCYKEKYSQKYTTIFSINNLYESEIGTSILYENNENIKLLSRENGNIHYYKSFFNELNAYTFSSHENKVNLENSYKKNKEIFSKLCNIADKKIKKVDITKNQDDGKEFLRYWVNNKNYLNYYQLSSGTQKIINLGCKILDTIDNSSLLFIDEIETGLHPALTRFLIYLINTSGKDFLSQLIFTTHSIEVALLLDNDQLYFINDYPNYEIMNVCEAINKKRFSKDKGLINAYIEGLLINNPNSEQIKEFIYKKNHIKI